VTVQTDSYTSPVLKYRRCDRNGCYVELAVDNAMVESLTKATSGKVNIVADNGKTFALNFSVKWFAAAHDDMVSQARAKAKAVEKTPAAPK
jgi:invasion protein IalB